MIINRGIIAFSIGHVFYFSALVILGEFRILSVIVSIAMTVIIVIGSDVMKFEMGKNRIPAYLYSALIFLMVGQALSLVMSHGFKDAYGLIFVGALLFGLSDLILAPIYFKNMATKPMIALNLLTYYAAQLLIALSVFYL